MIAKISREQNRSYKDFAVLYRANAQSRSVEDALNRTKYHIIYMVVQSSMKEKK